MGPWRRSIVIISPSTIDDDPRCSIDDVPRLVIRAPVESDLSGASGVASGTKPRHDHLCGQNSADPFAASEPESEQRLQPQVRNDGVMSDFPAYVPRDQV